MLQAFAHLFTRNLCCSPNTTSVSVSLSVCVCVCLCVLLLMLVENPPKLSEARVDLRIQVDQVGVDKPKHV